MRSAFISHATPDDRFVVELKGLILGLGYEFVFNDADYDSIAPDQEFWPRIVEGIQAADALVVVISEKSAVSTWVNKEVEYARDLKKRVLPILIEDCAIPELFRDRDVIDFRLGRRNPLTSENGRALRAYLDSLNEVLKKKRGVLSYVPRVGNVDDANVNEDDDDDDEFGYSVLVEEVPDLGSSSSEPGSASTDSLECVMALGEAIERHRAVVITGEPGAGKSTFIRRMAQIMAADFDRAGGNASVPILLDLTRWPSGKELDAAIEHACQGIPNSVATLQKLNHSLFLDGLNEVSDKDTVNTIVHAVKEAAQRIGPIGLQHLIITCRSGDYLAENKDGVSLKKKLGLPSITIRAMEKEEIGAFCESYLESTSADLIHIIQRNDLWELAGNAYMLGALIYIYKELGAEAFPTSTGDLFPRLIKALWTRETKRGYGGELTHLELTSRLGELAHWVTLEHGFGDFDLSGLPEELDPQRTVSGLARRCGLVDGTGEQIRFNHQLTQEYFNAEWFKETELIAPISSGNGIYTERFKNSFRMLGGMNAEHLGVRLFRIDPFSLVEWVRNGVYASQAYAELVMGLLELPPSDSIELPGEGGFYQDFSGTLFDALTQVVQHDPISAAPVLIKYLEREPASMSERSVVVALRAVEALSPEANRRLLQLLHDERSYSRYTPRGDYYDVAPTHQIRLRELAAEAIFRLGQEKTVASAIEPVLTWLDDSTMVEIDSGFSGIGSESNHERVGNRAFKYLLNGPARSNPILRQELRRWLERQESAEGVARVFKYSYFGTDGTDETSQAVWAKGMLRQLD